MASGLFVALEGPDGVGKTTAARGAAERLCAVGYPAVVADRRTLEGTSRYAVEHMTVLRTLIWGHAPEAPYLDLGDEHWVHLQAAWYVAYARCVVQPLRASGHLVLVDTWANKFLAKLALRPGHAVDVEHARGEFARLPQPDLTIFMSAEPDIAAARKGGYSAGETGNWADLSAEAFIAQQKRISDVMRAVASEAGWPSLDTSRLTRSQTADAVTGLIVDRIRSAQPVDGRAGHRGR